MPDPLDDILRRSLPEAAHRPLSQGYLEEPRGRYHGRASHVVAPGSTDEVSAAIRAARAAGVPVLPYGGGTGLVAGQVSPDGPAPMILSLERMQEIRGVYPRENVLVAEAGAVLAEVQKAAAEEDRLFPLSLGSEGTARIGGLLSTNAGGVNVLRYGNTRELTLGIEAVLPDGSVFHGLKRLRKDNTGYDLRNLLIGAEGTLGVITAAALRLFPRPRQRGAALLAVPSPDAALDLLSLAREIAGEGVSAFELMGKAGFDFLTEAFPDLRQPLAPAPDWSVLIDLGLGAGPSPESMLTELYSAAADSALVTDGVIASSEAQRSELWHLREAIPEANRKIGAVASHDISVPLGALPEFIAKGDEYVAAIAPELRVNCFGHVGDGNLHYNIFPPHGTDRAVYDDRRAIVSRTVHDLADSLGGSVSAEHGIGRLKVADLERYGDPVKLAAMRAIKQALDPEGLMNPGAVLRPKAD